MPNHLSEYSSQRMETQKICQKEKNRSRKKVGQKGYTDSNRRNTPSFHSSDPLLTFISKSLSTGCLHIGHRFVWNFKTFAHPLHIHCNMEEKKPIHQTKLLDNYLNSRSTNSNSFPGQKQDGSMSVGPFSHIYLTDIIAKITHMDE